MTGSSDVRLALCLALLALAGCGPETRQIRLVAPPGACAGVVRASLDVSGAGLHVGFVMDPGLPDCVFESATLDDVGEGTDRRASLEGRDSAGQLVIFGTSAPFDDPPGEGVTTVSVNRTKLSTATAVFTIPDDANWNGAHHLAVGSAPSWGSHVRLFPDTLDGQALDGGQRPRTFSVTGLPVQQTVVVLGLNEKEGTLAGVKCTLGEVAAGQVYVAVGKVSPAPCAVKTPAAP